jgi:hypothetical protein
VRVIALSDPAVTWVGSGWDTDFLYHVKTKTEMGMGTNT